MEYNLYMGNIYKKGVKFEWICMTYWNLNVNEHGHQLKLLKIIWRLMKNLVY